MRHPAHCDCESDDPRIVMCRVCGLDHPETPEGCPHCRRAVAREAALARDVARLRDMLDNIRDAYRRSDDARLHHLLTMEMQ